MFVLVLARMWIVLRRGRIRTQQVRWISATVDCDRLLRFRSGAACSATAALTAASSAWSVGVRG